MVLSLSQAGREPVNSRIEIIRFNRQFPKYKKLYCLTYEKGHENDCDN